MIRRFSRALLAWPAGRHRSRIVVLLAAALPFCADAGKVYRCGNQYQDQPCPEVRIADRASERPDPARDGTACTDALKKSSGRSDCGLKPTREVAPAGLADAKR